MAESESPLPLHGPWLPTNRDLPCEPLADYLNGRRLLEGWPPPPGVVADIVCADGAIVTRIDTGEFIAVLNAPDADPERGHGWITSRREAIGV